MAHHPAKTRQTYIPKTDGYAVPGAHSRARPGKLTLPAMALIVFIAAAAAFTVCGGFIVLSRLT